jgi:hypothetical protein
MTEQSKVPSFGWRISGWSERRKLGGWSLPTTEAEVPLSPRSPPVLLSDKPSSRSA